MKIKKYLLVMVTMLLLVSGFNIVEDPNFLQTLKTKLAQYNSTFPEEKVYLQFDKPFYKPGDDIWFNAFVLHSNTNQPTNISDVVYVELIDPKGNVVSRSELVIKEGTANGDFNITKDMAGGQYKVRAFTQWMKNFGKESMFSKDIQIQRIITPRLLLKLDFEKEAYGPGDVATAILKATDLKNEKIKNAKLHHIVTLNGKRITESDVFSDSQGRGIIQFTLPNNLSTTDGLLEVIVDASGVQESISRSIPIVLNKIKLQFFPEGGQYLENAESRIAIKALNEFGKGADVSGSIVDENNKTVSTFETFHMGMGAFRLKSLSGKKYYAKIEKPLGNSALIPLPSAQHEGFSLQIKSTTRSGVTWTIYSHQSTTICLVAQTHGEIVYAEKINLERGENAIEVSTEKFPVGIAVFTLFDGQNVEQCERLVFLNRWKGLSINIKTDKEKYSPQEKVELKIETTDHNGEPVPAKLALSVVDDQLISFADDKQDNLLTSFLLSSEVRGEIQEPSFYFDPEEPKASEALDYLLMTQGWRRFTWSDVKEIKRVITYNPEKVKNIAGRVVNKTVGVSSDVTLIELGNKRRIDKIKTTANGHFIFKNIDPTVAVLLLTKKPGEIALPEEQTIGIHLNDKDGTILLPAAVDENSVIPEWTTEERKDNERSNQLDVNVMMNEDITSLEEVVVTSLGVQRKSDLSASIVTIHDNDIDSRLPTPAFENLLQGRVAGVMVQQHLGSAGANAIIKIRGSSSFGGGRGEPLYVIDGFPMGSSLNQNFVNSGIIGAEDIASIEVISSPEGTAIYGSAAANGVILITTRSRVNHTQFTSKRKAGKFSAQTIYPRKFSVTREFYVAPPSRKSEKRDDFRTTIYWNHNIVTDAKGQATLSFYNNDAISAFRITAEGFAGSGLLGRAEKVYASQLPFSMDIKLPEFIGFEDTLRLPLHLKNTTSSALSGKISIHLPEGLDVINSPSQNIQLPAESTQTHWFTITSKGIEGEFPLSIEFQSPSYSDIMEHTIRVQSVGFPARLSFSGKELDKTLKFKISEAEKGSIKGQITAFPDVLGDLMTGAESMLQEPHGCFEQVSSSTFPNILALQFLQQSGHIQPEVEKRALQYIRDGYNKLMAYEIQEGGFEWFGHPPAHEGLTAFGLLEFYEMKKVFNGVERDMMDRTRLWLLSRRDGQGGFTISAGKYGFSSAGSEVSNAYMVYALSEIGSKEILPEYKKALEESLKSGDMYRMALLAIASYNLNEMSQYTKLTDLFVKNMEATKFGKTKASHSIVRSYGNSLGVETVSLWAIALMKSKTVNLLAVFECIQEIISYRSGGYFGNTQGTTMALKALTEYAKLVKSKNQGGEIQIFVDNKNAETIGYSKDTRNKIIMNRFGKNIKNDSEQQLRVLFNGTQDPLPYSIDIQWRTKKLQTHEQCKVSVTTLLNASVVRLNETVRLNITLRNNTTEGLPMTTSVIGIPAGLTVQSWQLKELYKKKVFDFYEIKGGNLTLYYRELGPSASHTINLDLKAEIPGKFTGSASSAYLYYTNEYKHWAKGNSILIN